MSTYSSTETALYSALFNGRASQQQFASRNREKSAF
jgi:hypothetical protein